jgi:hypothetical protein
MFASSFSSSRSKWNTKCKRDSAAPPIWLRRVLNDATNVDTASVSGVRGPGEHSLFHGNSFVEGRQEPQHCAALDGGGDRKQWQNPPAQGIGAEDATELYLNPLAFGSCNDLSRQVPGNASVPHEGGGYAAIHAQAAERLPNHGGRAVQSARRTRVNHPPQGAWRGWRLQFRCCALVGFYSSPVRSRSFASYTANWHPSLARDNICRIPLVVQLTAHARRAGHFQGNAFASFETGRPKSS